MPPLRPHNINPEPGHVRVALVHRDFSGKGVSHVGLGISCAYTAKTLRQAGIWAECWSEQSAATLGAHINQVRASGQLSLSHVVIAAPWISTPDIQALCLAYPDVNFAVISHSSIGFLSADPSAIRLLREQGDLQLQLHNLFIGGNALKFTDWVTMAWSVSAVCLPNLYNITDAFMRHPPPWSGAALRVGIFGASRPLKNFITAAAAAVELHGRLKVPTHVFMSSGRNEGGNFNPINEMTQGIPGLTVTQTGWLAWPAFRRLVRTMDLVLQPSYTETFNVVTADAIAEGVPVVVSEAIDWAPGHWKALTDEPLDVSRVGEGLLRDRNAHRDGRGALTKYVTDGLQMWRTWLRA